MRGATKPVALPSLVTLLNSLDTEVAFDWQITKLQLETDT